MDDAEEGRRKAGKNLELMTRGFAALPIKRNMLALKKRWEAGDPNVFKEGDEEGCITYVLEFTEKQRTDLEMAFINSRVGNINNAGAVPNDVVEKPHSEHLIQSWVEIFQTKLSSSFHTPCFSIEHPHCRLG